MNGSSAGDASVRGTGGGCATSHPLAVEVGLELLSSGGNAVDAAVAMAATLTVVEPTSNGLGSDAFALVWDGDTLHGLNGSGKSPQGLTPDLVREAGHDRMPDFGWLPVTVPGAPAAWHDLSRRFGKRPFAEVLEPAIRIARSGHRVPPVVAHYWERAHQRFTGFSGPEFDGWKSTFSFGGRAPSEGDTVVLEDHARSLERIAESGAKDFYQGSLASRMDAWSKQTGGILRAGDLASHENQWVDPLSVRYRDVDIWELPPNGQGIVALSALRILDGLSPGSAWDDVDGQHRAIEAIKMGFADAQEMVGDPRSMTVTGADMLDSAYLSERRSQITDRAIPRHPGLIPDAGTVFLVVADAGGMMVSLIQSNYMGFGSGVVVPGTGIALQNRGRCFSTEAGHPNQVGSSKRSFHTIIPGFLTRNGAPWGPMGVMGGHMQPQGHVQVVRGLVDFGLTPQQVLDLPRWRWDEGNRVALERGWSKQVTKGLADRGHELDLADGPGPFGRGQMILSDPGGMLTAASDRRADGFAGMVKP